VIVDEDGNEVPGGATEHDTTISRMELMGAIDALESVRFVAGPCVVLVYSDSEYVVTHDTIISYGPNNGVAGCGIRWTHVYSTYMGTQAERAVQGFRPDLVFVDPPEVPGQQFVD
jgi:hypothetical protein